MNTALSGMLAIELRPHSPGEWLATYYPVADTAAGRVADINLVLHEHPLPTARPLEGAATWLEADSPDPDAPCYASHEAWAPQLAAGYAEALAVYDTETVDAPSSLEDPDAVRAATVLVDPAQFQHGVDAGALDLPGKRMLSHFLSPLQVDPAHRPLRSAGCCRN